MAVKQIQDEMLLRMIAQEAGLGEELPVFVMIHVGKPDGGVESISYPQDKVIGVDSLYALMKDNLESLQSCGKAMETYLAQLNHFAAHLAEELNGKIQGDTGSAGEHRAGTDPAGGGAAGKEETGPKGQ